MTTVISLVVFMFAWGIMRAFGQILDMQAMVALGFATVISMQVREYLGGAEEERKETLEFGKMIDALECLTGYVEMKIRDGDRAAPSEHVKDAREFINIMHYGLRGDDET